MASPNIWPGSFSSAGPLLATYGSNYFSGSIFWLDNSASTASDANAGTEPELPLATLNQAFTNASANDTIIIGASHQETISSTITLAKAFMRIVGLGSGTSRPRLTSNVAGSLLTPTASGVSIENIQFPAATAASTGKVVIQAAATNCLVRDCTFDLGATDAAGVLAAGAGTRLSNCTFTAVASRPTLGLNINVAFADGWFEGLTFDGGSYGWTQPAFSASAAPTRLTMVNCRLLNRSDLLFVTGSSYQMFGLRTDNTGCRIVITA